MSSTGHTAILSCGSLWSSGMLMAGVLHQAPTIDLENFMNRVDETDSSTAHGLLLARKAILEGRMHLPPHLQRIADELTSAPLTALGLVDPTGLSRETVMMAKSFAAATAMARQPSPEDSPAASPNLLQSYKLSFSSCSTISSAASRVARTASSMTRRK